MNCHNLIENLKNSQGNLNISPKKVSIIGCNEVAVYCIAALIKTEIAMDICLIDYNYPEKANAEILDFQNCAPPYINLTSSSVIEDAYASDVCVICLTILHKSNCNNPINDTNFFEKAIFKDIFQYYAAEYKRIIPIITMLSPNVVFIIATFPTTTLSYLTWKSSKLPIHRIIGIGTAVDTLQLKYFVARNFGVPVIEVHGYVVGSIHLKIALWSGVSVAGSILMDVDSGVTDILRPDGFSLLNKRENIFSTKFSELKGLPHISIGCICASLIKAVLTDSQEIFTVSTKNKGLYGLQQNVFLSLPCIIGANGVKSILTPTISQFELTNIQISATNLLNMHKEYLQEFLQDIK